MINPTKHEAGKIEKYKLDEITKIVRENSGLTQWTNTYESLNGFMARVKNLKAHLFNLIFIISIPQLLRNSS